MTISGFWHQVCQCSLSGGMAKPMDSFHPRLLVRHTVSFCLVMILMISLLWSPAYGFEPLTPEDKSHLALYTTLHLMDWKQTRMIAKNPGAYYETNTILGEHPSVGKVDAYFLTTLAGQIAATYLLPPKARRIWQMTWISIEKGYVEDNLNIGLVVRF